MTNVHPKVVATGVVGALCTVALAVSHLVSTGNIGIDTATLVAAVVTVANFAAGYLKSA